MAVLTSSFLNVFKHDDKTVIVNITSLAAIQVIKGLGIYGVGKAAREMYFKVLSSESADLRILSYAPGNCFFSHVIGLSIFHNLIKVKQLK